MRPLKPDSKLHTYSDKANTYSNRAIPLDSANPYEFMVANYIQTTTPSTVNMIKAHDYGSHRVPRNKLLILFY